MTRALTLASILTLQGCAPHHCTPQAIRRAWIPPGPLLCHEPGHEPDLLGVLAIIAGGVLQGAMRP